MTACTPLRFSLYGLLLLATLATGCTGYRMGYAEAPPVRSLHLFPIANRTDAADLASPLAVALREAILARSAIRLSEAEERAGGTLEVVLDQFQRTVAATDPRDSALGDSFRIVLSGRATLLRADGTVLFRDRPFRAETAVVGREDLVQAENQAAAVLARDFAERVARAIYSAW